MSAQLVQNKTTYDMWLTNIQETDVAVSTRTLLKGLEVLCQDVFIIVRLHSTQFHAQNSFALCGKRFEYVALQPSQHQRLELCMQLLDLGFMICVVEIELAGQCNYIRVISTLKRNVSGSGTCISRA